MDSSQQVVRNHTLKRTYMHKIKSGIYLPNIPAPSSVQSIQSSLVSEEVLRIQSRFMHSRVVIDHRVSLYASLRPRYTYLHQTPSRVKGKSNKINIEDFS